MIGKIGQRLSKDFRIGGRSPRGCFAGLRLVFSESMEFVRLRQRRSVALPLLGETVEDDRLFLGFEELKGTDQKRYVMTVNRALIAQAEILKDHSGQQDLLHSGLYLVGEMPCRLASDPFDELRRLIMEMGIGWAGGDAVEMLGNGTGILGNRPFVVVENHDEFFRRFGHIVERLKADAAGEGGVARHNHDMLAPAVHIPRGSHAEGCREGRSGMTRPVAVVVALGTEKETVETAILAHGGKSLAATRQDFVHISLMADIKEDLVGGRCKHTVQGNREFHHAEVRAEMPAGLRKSADQFAPDIPGQAGKVGFGKFLEISRTVDPIQ